VVSALLAAAILIYALSRYRESVNDKNKPVTVLIASQFIEKGTAGDAIGVGHFVRSTRVVGRQATAGALTDPAALHGEVAAADIYAGQQLTAADFVSGGLVSSLASTQRAVSVPLDASHGMIGDIHTGDHVDVYASFQARTTGLPVVRLLAPNVVVLKAGQSSGGGIGASNNPTNNVADVVLEVNTRQAAELAYTADFGKVWLDLRPGQGSNPGKEIVTENTILLSNSAGALEGHR
jgi:Flp pilus assembly protein CpaB